MFKIGIWNEDRHQQLVDDLTDEVRAASKKAESYGTLGKGPAPGADGMFHNVYKEMPAHLRRQRQEVGV